MIQIRDQKSCICICLIYVDKQYRWAVKEVDHLGKYSQELTYYFLTFLVSEFKEKIN